MATTATTPKEPESSGGGMNMLYLVLALIIGLLFLAQYQTMQEKSIKNMSDLKKQSDETFDVKKDIAKAGNGVAIYELPEGSIAAFTNLDNVRTDMTETGRIEISTGESTAIMNNDKWENPSTSNSSFSCKKTWKITALSEKAVIKFTKRQNR